jgi:hypothetical protein
MHRDSPFRKFDGFGLRTAIAPKLREVIVEFVVSGGKNQSLQRSVFPTIVAPAKSYLPLLYGPAPKDEPIYPEEDQSADEVGYDRLPQGGKVNKPDDDCQYGSRELPPEQIEDIPHHEKLALFG